jgi:putative ABC transport system substrate-binding protein
MLPDATLVRPEVVDHLLLFSFQNKVPVFTFAKKYVEMGALAGLNIVPQDIGAQSAEISRRLRNDSSQAPIRVNARKTVIMVNRKIANKLGVKIRDEVLKRAEDVY